MATKMTQTPKTPMSPKDASRVQSATARSGDGNVDRDSFAARAQRAGRKNQVAQKVTQPTPAKAASQSLTNKATGQATRSAAGSALSQVQPSKVTSQSAAKAASTVLLDGRTSNTSKSAAGSALSQRPSTKR